MLTLAFLLACSPETSDEAVDPGTETTTSVPTTSSETLSTGDTGSVTQSPALPKPWELPVDCSAGLELPLEMELFTWNPAHEDFTFHPDGLLVGVTGNQLRHTPFGGPAEFVSPVPDGITRGTRYLPDGSLLLANAGLGALVKVYPEGGYDVLGSGMANPNGIAIGADGLAYVATSGKILRVDPTTASVETLADLGATTLDGLTFTPDYQRLYFNTEFGRIWFIDFDAEGQVTGPAKQGADLPVGPLELLDGMTMDACGNLWVSVMTGEVWRISAEGAVELAISIDALAFIPALNFGTGTGGFEESVLYIMDFGGRLFAAETGIPGKWEPHMPLPEGTSL